MQDKKDGPFREPKLPRTINDYLASNTENFSYVRGKLPDLLGEGSELNVHIPFIWTEAGSLSLRWPGEHGQTCSLRVGIFVVGLRL